MLRALIIENHCNRIDEHEEWRAKSRTQIDEKVEAPKRAFDFQIVRLIYESIFEIVLPTKPHTHTLESAQQKTENEIR